MSDGRCSSGLSEDGDPVFVAPKQVNVLVHPLQGEHLVEHAHVAGPLVRVQAEEAQGSQSVVDGHDDHICNLLEEVTKSQ